MDQVEKLHAEQRRRRALILVVLALGLGLAVLWAIQTGPVAIPTGMVLRISLYRLMHCLLPHRLWAGIPVTWPHTHEIIVIDVRWPRILLGVLVGAALATSGCTMQGLFRNPMASPYTLGLASGAAFGAALAIVLEWPFYALPALAFLFAVLTVFVVYRIASVRGGVPMETLLLAGLATGSFFSALVSFMLYIAGEKLAGIVFWLMGGLWASDWDKVLIALPLVSLGTTGIFLLSRDLDLLLLGDEQAQALGVNTERVKKIALALASLITAAAVCGSGVIGFVGLIVPHLMRTLVGPEHRLLLPASWLVGALLLVCTDTLARAVIQPTEIPVGIITALLGAPFFVYLLRRRKQTLEW
ncbi:MAG TPA: iron chelate uptake ABC transporter family permease subunit [Caldilineae bacterium]|nr:iron chelate uptake ABC transporter family permease subunit [Caldilineae bacterium]